MSSPKYDLRLNPVYQVDFSTSSKGKRVALTKRNVRFAFGFSDADAIVEGFQGIHCRGEEHEVTLVWSLTSGKRVVMADGEEVHFSQGKRTEMKFECSWTMKGNHVVKLVAHATPSVLNNPGFRQFELFLDGMSFFDMPKIFELGVASAREILGRGGAQGQMAFAAPAQSYEHKYLPEDETLRREAQGQMTFAAPAQSSHEYGYLPEEENQWAQSVQDYEFRYNINRAPTVMDVCSPLPARHEPGRAESMPLDLVSEPTAVQDLLAPPPPAFTFQTSSFAYAPAAPGAAVDEFAPIAPPPVTYRDVSNDILSAYGPAQTAPALLALTYEPHTHYAPVAPAFAPQQHTFLAAPASPTLSATTPSDVFFESPTTTTGYGPQPEQGFQESPTSVRQLSDLEKAMNSLVNFDDIGEPALSPMKLTMQKEKEGKKNNGKSYGLPPVSAWNIGTQASLADIKAHASQRAAPSQEVMRTHAFRPTAAQAGMLVVYGAAPTQTTPPI